MTRLRTAFVLLVLIAVAALSACTSTVRKESTSGGSAASGGSADGSVRAPAASNELASGGPATGSTASGRTATVPGKEAPDLQSRDMVETATIAVNVDDVDATADAMVARATRVGGRIDGDTRSSNEQKRHATLVIRIPPNQLSALLDSARNLGEEQSRTRKGDDVTTARADIDARVLALRDSISRLTEFLRKSGNINDLVRLEQELSQRQSELDSTVAQQRALKDQIALATLTVDLSAKPIVPAAAIAARDDGPLGFGSALGNGWDGMMLALRWSGAILGYALPYMVLALVAAAALAFARRRRVPAPVTPGPDGT